MFLDVMKKKTAVCQQTNPTLEWRNVCVCVCTVTKHRNNVIAVSFYI